MEGGYSEVTLEKITYEINDTSITLYGVNYAIITSANIQKIDSSCKPNDCKSCTSLFDAITELNIISDASSDEYINIGATSNSQDFNSIKNLPILRIKGIEHQ